MSKVKPDQHLNTCRVLYTYEQFMKEFLVRAENIFKALLALGHKAEGEWDAIKIGLESIKWSQLFRSKGSKSWATFLNLWDFNY